MKFKVGDRVENIINKRKGIITVISKTEDIDKFNGQFKQPYYVSYDNCTGNWHTMVEIEKVEEILDEKEKEYLRNIIKPFKNQIINISKYELRAENLEYIGITYNEINNKSKYELNFPYFNKNSMYKNMEIRKKYTLKDLNLN